MITEPQKKVILVPVYNGSYFNSLLKLAHQISDGSEMKIVFFFGNSYPKQDEHLALLEGKFEYLNSGAYGNSLFRKSRISQFLRRFRTFDEFVNFFETVWRFHILRKELKQFWKIKEVVLCLFPANNRYMYSCIESFAVSRNTRVVVAPQWFAGPQEIEESLAHSIIYRPNVFERWVIGFIAPNYLRNVTRRDFTFQMIPIRFSEILINRIFGCLAPQPWILHSGFSDRIFVETAATYDFAISLGFNESQLRLTGSVYLDEIEEYKSLKSKNIRLLVAVAPDMFSSRIGVDLQFSKYEDYLIFVCTELQRIGYADATFSMHPSDTGKYGDLIRSFGFQISREPLHLLLVNTEVFLATISATIQWAIYLEIPTVNFDFYGYDYPDYLGESTVIHVHDKTKIEDALISAVKSQNLNLKRVDLKKDQINRDYGTCAEKILSEIYSLMEEVT